MIDINAVRERLLRKGFPKINECNDLPNEILPDHTHPGDLLIIVLGGSMDISMDGKTYTLKAGSEILIPAKAVHSSVIGAEGCHYIDGERA